MRKVPNHIGRRALLRGTALATVATALPTLPALAVAGGDRALIDAETEVARLYQWLGANPDADEKLERDPVYEHAYALEDFIATTPPETLAGVAVKLRRLLDREVGMEPNGVNDIPCLLSMLSFIHGTIGEPTHPTRPVYTGNEERDTEEEA